MGEKMMKALRMYKPGDIRFEMVPVPTPKDGEVLLKITAVGICGSDIPRILTYGAHVSPIIPGHEFAAEIVEVTDSIKNFKVGDRVTVPPLMPCHKCKWCEVGEYALCEDYDYFGSRRDGAFAQYLCCPEENLMKLADSITDEEAATTDPCANAMHALHISDFKAGQTVAVYGAGAIGLYAIGCAKALGAKKVISVDINDEKSKYALEAGADYAINSLKEDAVDKIDELTDGGADIVIDVTGAPIAQKNCILSAGRLGKVILLGISHQPLTLSDVEVDRIMRRQLDVKGSWNSFTAPFPGKDWTVSLQLFEQNKLNSNPVITHRFSLEEGPEVFKKIADKSIVFNKILFLPWN